MTQPAADDPIALMMRERNRRFYEGQQEGAAVIASDGVSVAQAQLSAALPAGSPCTLSIDDFRYWSGFRRAIEEAQEWLS